MLAPIQITGRCQMQEITSIIGLYQRAVCLNKPRSRININNISPSLTLQNRMDRITFHTHRRSFFQSGWKQTHQQNLRFRHLLACFFYYRTNSFCYIRSTMSGIHIINSYGYHCIRRLRCAIFTMA